MALSRSRICRPHRRMYAAAFLLDARMWWYGRNSLEASDFSFVIVVVALISGFSVITFMKLDTDAGASISGRER